MLYLNQEDNLHVDSKSSKWLLNNQLGLLYEQRYLKKIILTILDGLRITCRI
jgi:hypothetical protein